MKLDRCYFTWDDPAQAIPSLRNVSLSVRQGELIALVGVVGSGKSSLLSAMLGELNKTSGEMSVNVSVT